MAESEGLMQDLINAGGCLFGEFFGFWEPLSQPMDQNESADHPVLRSACTIVKVRVSVRGRPDLLRFVNMKSPGYPEHRSDLISRRPV